MSSIEAFRGANTGATIQKLESDEEAIKRALARRAREENRNADEKTGRAIGCAIAFVFGALGLGFGGGWLISKIEGIEVDVDLGSVGEGIIVLVSFLATAGFFDTFRRK